MKNIDAIIGTGIIIIVVGVNNLFYSLFNKPPTATDSTCLLLIGACIVVIGYFIRKRMG